MPRKILIATTNKGKAAELAAMLGTFDVDVQWLTLADFPDVPDVPEDGRTFAENARKKALGYAEATGCWTLADDSGLVVDALDGAPGIHSARFSGPAPDPARRQLLDHRNMAKVLQLMQDVPDHRRTARFVCNICLASPSEVLAETAGTLEGRIARQEHGDHGFGYDPIFLLSDNRTVAQLSPDEKNALSHRATALRQMRPIIQNLLRTSS